MDYKELDAETLDQMKKARVRQYEESHYQAVLDEQAAVAVGDSNSVEQAKKRQQNFENAIAAIDGSK